MGGAEPFLKANPAEAGTVPPLTRWSFEGVRTAHPAAPLPLSSQPLRGSLASVPRQSLRLLMGKLMPTRRRIYLGHFLWNPDMEYSPKVDPCDMRDLSLDLRG